MGETLTPDVPAGPRGEPAGWARLATLAAGASALVVAGWCGAFVSRSLDPGPSAPPVPSVVLPPVGPPTAVMTAAAPLGPAPSPAAQRPVAARPPLAPATSVRSGVLSVSLAPARRAGGAVDVPVPVRTARLAPGGPAIGPAVQVAAPRLATAPTPPTSSGPGTTGRGSRPGPPDGPTVPVGPLVTLQELSAHRWAFASGGAESWSAGPGRPADRVHRGAADGDIDRS